MEPSRRLGPYEIVAPLGAGGMGEVYKARDTRLDRIVAIKILPETLAADPQFRERFDREAKTISQLSHAHICTLFDVGHQDGTDSLVLEYLEGETLAERIPKSALKLDEALRIAIEIADALATAHRAGIVHRDLKPGNIFLVRSGGASALPTAKLLDFGLAKQGAGWAGMAGRAGTGPGSVRLQPDLTAPATMTTPLTAQGTILGTFQYMAPEQIEGQDADARTDIFAFGVCLYEMTTGRKAFQGKTHASLIGSILKDTPPAISTIQPMTPPALDRVVRTCLEKSADDRFQTAHDLLLQLRWIAEVGTAVDIPAPVVARRKNRELDAAAISPDGRRLVFVAAQDNVFKLWLRPIDALKDGVIVFAPQSSGPLPGPPASRNDGDAAQKPPDR